MVRKLEGTPEEENLIQGDGVEGQVDKNTSSIGGASFNFINSIIGSGIIGKY